MRRCIKGLTSCLAVLLAFFLGAEPIPFDIKGEAAILMNAETGVILYEHEAYTLHYPASTTKVATALFTLKKEGGNLDTPITAEQDALGSVTQEAKRKSNYTLPTYWQEPDGTHIGIKKGETLTLRNLLEGMLIASGNDAANVIAQGIGPSIPGFVEEMNAYLKEIGCTQTHFLNPHGLHDPNHQTTAYDLALIAKEALKNPVFCEIVAKTRFIRPKTNKQEATTLLQTNRLLRQGKYFYAKAIGVKTGYHAKAKSTFIAASRSEGRTLIAVLLGYPERGEMFEDAKNLFEKAFNQPRVQRRYLKEGPQTFTTEIPHGKKPLRTCLSESLTLDFYPAEDPQAKCLLYWDTLALPIVKGQKVGELQLVSVDGDVLKKAPLLASESVKMAWPHNWLAVFSSLSWIVIFAVALVGSALLWFIVRKR